MVAKGIVKLSGMAIFIVLFLSSCSEDAIIITDEPSPEISIAEVSEGDINLVYEWYELYLDIEKDLQDFRPNPTSRALAYIGIAAYEAIVPGMTGMGSLSSVLDDFPSVGDDPYDHDIWAQRVESELYWEAVLNQVYHETFSYFLYTMDAAQRLQVEQLFLAHAQRLNAQMSPIGYQDAIDRGTLISTSIILYAQSDIEGETQVYDVEPEGYVPPSGVGYWQPTEPDFRNACHPYWHKVRKFVTPNTAVNFVQPAEYSEDPNSRFYKEALEVNDVVANLDHEERWIAEFWSDDIVGITFSPPARQVSIANQLVLATDVDLQDVIEMYLRLGIALNDAAVTCWQGKYEFNLERPIDYIRRVINPDFTTILGDAEGIPSQNPNFPAYPSGHSTFASAGAAVFERFFSIHVRDFTDRSHEGATNFNGAPRTFSNFHLMARENAYSRIPLGVHFRMDCDEGLRLGYIVGDYATRFSLRQAI